MNRKTESPERSRRIMIAEDDPGIIDAMQIMLEINDYEVITTINGRTLRDMKEDLPDLLLLDIWMSGEDGKAICRHLKSQEITKHIPIILVSASKDLEKAARNSGADDFLAKPFEMQDLLSMIEKHLN